MTDTQDPRPEDQSPAAVPPAGAEPQADAQAVDAPASVPPVPALPTATGETAPTVAQPAAPQAATETAPTAPTIPLAPAAGPAYTASQGTPEGAVPTYPGQAFGLPPQVAVETDERKKSGAGKVVALLVAAALVGGAAGLGGAAAGAGLFASTTASAPASTQVVTVNDTASVNATTAVAAKVLPSTVTISASSGSSGGTGSGVILSADGYVLTNTHVVTLDGASANTTLSVTTSDGHVYSAKIVGTDPTYDLAVIKLTNASGLTPIEFGDSAALNVGDETIAIGAPLGLANTVTTGIVSALNRSIEIQSSAAPSLPQDQGDQGNGDQFRFDFGQGQSQSSSTATIKIAVIQTDAAINPGNSGGALVDSDGRLIGINVAIATAGSSSGTSSANGSIGVGFAIPSDIAERVSKEIIASGSASHGLLGANVQNAATVKGSTITGAYISNVTAGGPAAGAGIQTGDIVTAFNGAPITNAVDLTAQVRALPAGATATVTYVRDGQSRTAQVTLGRSS